MRFPDPRSCLRSLTATSSRRMLFGELSGRTSKHLSSMAASTPSRESRVIKVVTLDVTGTLIEFSAHIGEFYGSGVLHCGAPCPTYDDILKSFHVAYKDMDARLPCFGYFDPNVKDTRHWWSICVKKTLLDAGCKLTDAQFEEAFDHIYALFGGAQAYNLFPDVVPFTSWCKSQDIKVGILSNGTTRYRTQVMPALGAADNIDFWVLSGETGVAKPDPRAFEMCKDLAGPGVAYADMLHVGDSFRKDWVPAHALGMHAILLDRFKHVREKKNPGGPLPVGFQSAHVEPDLDHVRQWIQFQQT